MQGSDGEADLTHGPAQSRADSAGALLDDDGALLARIAGGDRVAFATLVRRHHAPLHRWVAALSRDPAGADDALQEAFLAVWRSAGSFRGDASARAWLYTIARNCIHRQKRRVASDPIESLEQLGEQAGWGDTRACARVEEALADRERLARVLDQLPVEDREVLLLVEGEGLSLVEAAAAAELTLAALKSRLHRARLRVVALLAKEDAREG